MDDKFQWADQTTIHPLGIAVLAALALAMLLVPRRYAVLPMLLLVCAVSARQRLVIGDLDFTFLRVLVLVGWLRVLLRGELRPIRPHALDYCLAGSVLAMGTAAVLRTGALSTLVFHLGQMVDAIGMYFLLRVLLRGWEDFRLLVTCFALLGMPLAVAFLVEFSTGRNMFSVFGGVPEQTMIRNGRLRCQGPFSHPILAGAFWTAALPLFVGHCWRPGSARVVGAIGAAVSLLIVVLSASSTPLGGIAAALVAAAFFPLRRSMRAVRWGILLSLAVLHFAMEAPVWHLISRIDLVGGSTGWHRYHLIDQAIQRVGEWALVGTNSTAHWGHMTQDVANQYVLVATRGGLLSLVLFIAVLAYAYRAVGVLVRRNRGRRVREVQSWFLGVALFTHTVMFMAVSYFGQVFLIWYLELALIGSLYTSTRSPDRQRSTRRRAAEPRRAPERGRPPAGEGAARNGRAAALLRRRGPHPAD